MKNNKPNSFPPYGMDHASLLNQMQLDKQNDLKWKEGKAFCLVYYPGDEKAELIKEAYNLYFTENALNPMSFPSLRKYETKVVSMVADLLHGDADTTGTLTSGGTESLLMVVKTARDLMRKEKPYIVTPEIILPVTAHPAFEKACHYFDVVPVYVSVDENYQADIKEIENAISLNTILIVGSAPSYPQGIIDPIEKISELALKHNLLFHVDACIGGFILPFIKKLNYPIPDFDFKLKGVTSISVDLHKYGYAAKGASVILYRNHEIRKFQFFVSTGWPGGIYGSPSMAGSRPGGAIAASYAAIMGIGEEGYLEMARKTMEVKEKIQRVIESISDLKILGKPEACILSFDSDQFDIYELADELNILGWHIERLQNPRGIHLTFNQIHTISADKFIFDLQKSVEKVKRFNMRHVFNNIKLAAVKSLLKLLPGGAIAKLQSKFSGKVDKSVRTAPMYGMMGVLTGTEDLNQIVLQVLDKLNTAD